MKIFKCFGALAVLAFSVASVVAQNTTNDIFNNIELSIRKNANLVTTLNRVVQLKHQALLARDYNSFSHCCLYQMNIADLRSEDTLYFRNSAFIDSTLMDVNAPLPLKALMHLLQAKRLSDFNRRGLRFSRSRYETKNQYYNYAAFTHSELDSLALYHFLAAKEIVLANKMILNNISWLSSDPTVFLFPPREADIVLAEVINHSRSGLPDDFNRKSVPWLSLSPPEFIDIIDSLARLRTKRSTVFQCFSEWLHLHKKDNNAFFYIESLARKYVYSSTPYSDSIEKIYEQYLSSLVLSPYPAVKANGVYQLCLRWNMAAADYAPASKWNDFDTSVRYKAFQALTLYESNKEKLDSFPFLGKVLISMKAKILSRDLEVELNDQQVPDKPILTQIKYRNIQRLYYRIIKIPFTKYQYLKNRPFPIKLSQLSYVRDTSIELPGVEDHNRHHVLLKIDGLPKGQYCLLVADKNMEAGDSSISFVPFSVTSISVISNGTKIFVLDRLSGMPLQGAIARAPGRSKRTYATYTVNRFGYFTSYRNNFFEIYYKDDTSQYSFDYSAKEMPDETFDRDLYDSYTDFYIENTEMHVFADRSIYRPGQAVHYKVIFTTRNRKTGEVVLLNRTNCRHFPFSNALRKWTQRDKPYLYITDPFDRYVDSIRILPNDYGAITGTFVIPKKGATGEWNFEADDIDDGLNGGSFRVEEYKRPTYEVKIEKPKKEIKPGDIFTCKVKIHSFAGASLANVSIEYQVRRDMQLLKGLGTDASLKEIVLQDTFAYSNQNGELEIHINDSSLKTVQFSADQEWRFKYYIKVKTIDQTGEAFSDNATVTLSTRPVLINIPLKGSYDRNGLPSILVTARDENAGVVSKTISISFYKIINETPLLQSTDFPASDMFLYPLSRLQSWFPATRVESGREVEPQKEFLFTKEVNTSNYANWRLSPDTFLVGKYRYEAVCWENGIVKGNSSGTFSIFDVKEHRLAESTFFFHKLQTSDLQPGDTLKVLEGNSLSDYYSLYNISYYAKDGSRLVLRNVDDFKHQPLGLNEWKFVIPGNAEIMEFTHAYILNNKFYRKNETIRLNKAVTEQPQIYLEQYRPSLTPGKQQSYVASIKTKNEHIAAELMTSIYDKSLDKLEPHYWRMPYIKAPGSPDNSWSHNFNDLQSYNIKVHGKAYGPVTFSDSSAFYRGGIVSRLDGVTNSLLVNAKGLGEVVATINTGYQAIGKERFTGSVTVIDHLNIRGISTLSGSEKPFIIIDNIPFEGDLSKLDPSLISQVMVIKDATAASIWGARAGNGLIVISTKGPINLLFPEPQEPVIKVRTNLNETAFFSPAIYADKDGYYRFSFAMPESLTEWNWKLFAHTKNASFAYTERQLTTRLPLMVQPNVPRFLYQGDRIVVKTRISNLDTVNVKGISTCKVEDLVTGEDITRTVLSNFSVPFSASKKSNTVSDFELRIPEHQINPLKLVITAKTNELGDAEEHTIPILTKKILVQKSVRFNSTASDTTLQPPVLSSLDKPYGVGIFVEPPPQTALINSLPFLANYSYDCAEQTFNKLYAYATAVRIMRHDKQVGLLYEEAKLLPDTGKVLEKSLNSELPDETTPWLSLLGKNVLQHKQLMLLFDTMLAKSKISDHLDRLYKLQNSDGGLAWFDGGKTNKYISFYVLEGIGRLRKSGWEYDKKSYSQDPYNQFQKKLLNYAVKTIGGEPNVQAIAYPIYNLYALSFWIETLALNDSTGKKIKQSLSEEWTNNKRRSLHQQAILIITTLRFFEPGSSIYQKALEQLVSIQQLAINDENGIRWKEIADSDDLDVSAEETIDLIYQAFNEAGKVKEVSDGLIKWILINKHEQHWQTTKGTAAAIDLLSSTQNSVAESKHTLNCIVNNKNLSVSNGLFAGQSFAFTRTDVMQPVKLTGDDQKSINANLCWYYFSATPPGAGIQPAITIKKAFSYFDKHHHQWQPIDTTTFLHIGDEVMVKLSIETEKALRYVLIQDKLPACLEPVNKRSGYDYEQEFDFYRSIRDSEQQYFSEFIPSGKTLVKYKLMVTQEGNFSNGPSVLRCMYNPAIAAYSNDFKIQIK